MQLSPAEARLALEDIDRTTTLSAKATCYRRASPYLLLWGVVWMLGYGAPALAPGLNEAWSWPVLDLLGALGSVIISLRTPRSEARTAAGKALQIWAALGLGFLFVFATFAVLRPTQLAQVEVFPALVLGLAYGLVGIFGRLPRYFWVAAIAPASGLAAYFFDPAALNLTMAIAAGGSLVLSGLWMRRL